MTEPDKPGTRDQLELTIISEREKPALDEATFQQLLEAAHVLQEQKTFEVEPRSRPDPTEALAQIVETQEFLRSQAGDLQVAANVIVERLRKITHATGVAVAVVRENRLEYCAATGDAASLTGSSLPMDSSLVRGRTALHRIQPRARGQTVDGSAALSRRQPGRPAGNSFCGR